MRTICRFWVAHLTEIMGDEHMNDEFDEDDEEEQENENTMLNQRYWNETRR